MKVILASSSPRRQFLLRSLGFDLEIFVPDVDETQREGESPFNLVQRLARSKAQSVAEEPSCPIVAADTVVVLDGMVLGKPDDDEHANRMLTQLSGRRHEVLTGYAVRLGKQILENVVSTTVWFRSLTPQEIERYVSTKEPLGKSGSYAIQQGGVLLIDRIEGSYSNVIGLPIKEVLETLELISHAS